MDLIINMNILDKIALNRLIKIISDFIIAITKIFAKCDNTPDNICPIKKPRFPRLRKTIDKIFKEENETNE